MRIPASHTDAPRLYGPEFAYRPAGIYREMRQRYGPVAPVLLESDVPAWLVLGYRELYQVTTMPEVFARSPVHWNLLDEIPEDWPHRPMTAPVPAWPYSDDPEHQRRLGIVSDALDAIDHTDFTRTCVRTADRLIDQFCQNGATELITQYAQRMPTRVMARFYGLPNDAADALANDLVLVGGQGPDGINAQMRIFATLSEHVAGLRSRPATILRTPCSITRPG